MRNSVQVRKRPKTPKESRLGSSNQGDIWKDSIVYPNAMPHRGVHGPWMDGPKVAKTHVFPYRA